ncbi:hypothetical protein [Crocosphaera sp. XPORK-15E]|uniref:hypothetical protein n=1 Tax=Crocosphaera sp. XPORK-15E TaxID=3110247 RepID=UPI002B210424|nr:hypothetical protein [Crocosphaera sp. XPORK-15E]MEA5537050.1 hypothetical protein [Crocosphaera sp. XPORK-15E]
MAKYSCVTLSQTWANLSVAANQLRKLKTDNETANSLLLELETATYLAEAFNKIWHSIFWNKASKKTRLRMTRTLEKLAKMIFDHLEESIKLFDQLCEEQEQLQTLELTNAWIQIKYYLGSAKSKLENTHGKFIKPLPLFEYLDKISSLK